MELRQLKYFATLARTLNFSEAARCLYITQGTLSQQIKALEDEIGSQLFERNTREVTLTEAGTELLPLALQTLESSELCRSRMNDLQGALSGTLKLGTTHSFTGLVNDTVRNFLKSYPGVKLEICCETAVELLSMIRNKELDLAVAFQPVKNYDEIESEPLFKTHLSVVMRKGHPLSDSRVLTIGSLENQALVLPGGGLQSRRTFDSFVGIDTRKLDVRVELNDPDLIMDIVQGTDLVSVMSSLATYYRPNLVAIPLQEGQFSMTGCVHRLRGGYRKRSSEIFLDMLRESAHIERICKNLSL